MEAKQIRALARERLQGAWGISIGVAAVACLLGEGCWLAAPSCRSWRSGSRWKIFTARI